MENQADSVSSQKQNRQHAIRRLVKGSFWLQAGRMTLTVLTARAANRLLLPGRIANDCVQFFAEKRLMSAKISIFTLSKK